MNHHKKGNPGARISPGTNSRCALRVRRHQYGIDDKTIQGVMRYSEQRTTTNIYIKTNVDAVREGLQKVGEAFRSRKVVRIKPRKSA